MVQVSTGPYAGRTGYVDNNSILIFDDQLMNWTKVPIEAGYTLV